MHRRCPRSPLQNSDNCSPFKRDGNGGSEREPSQRLTACQQQSQDLNQSSGPIPHALWPSSQPPSCSFPWENLLATGTGHSQPVITLPPVSPRPQALCPCDSATLTKGAVCLYPRLAPHLPQCSSPSWRRSREPDISKTWGEQGALSAIKMGQV